MADDELFTKIKALIADKLGVDDESKITMEAKFREDLGADSLDTYELVYAIEEELEVKIPDETANKFVSVKDAYDFIKSQK
ncbi:MAG: acyl carrier protein [Treponemataceae bacterium]|nr:MAG: acyl carrier protein [Treponemataceae bacterium]